MSTIKEIEKELKKIYKDCGYEVDSVLLLPSNRLDLGEYQLNDCMKLAKIYHKSPLDIAKDIVEKLKKDDRFINVNIAGAGFINISLSDSFLIDFVNKVKDDIKIDFDMKEKKKIIIDYGGANCAKALHVGHLRSANIGEAIKRLAEILGYDVLGDTHLGDSGFNAGATVMEMEDRYPDLLCFSDGYNGEEFDLPIKKEDLNEIYPAGSKKAKEDEELLERARSIALEIQNNNPRYSVLWDKIKEMSIENIKELIDTVMNDGSHMEAIENARKETWAYQGKSAEVITDYLINKRAEILEKARKEQETAEEETKTKKKKFWKKKEKVTKEENISEVKETVE